MIDIYDNVLEPHLAELIDLKLKQQTWKYDYHSQQGTPNKHWHVFCGHNPWEVTSKDYEWLMPIWDTALAKYDFKKKYNVSEFKRLYLNAHTHGIEPHMHMDDGDFTMMYYPRLDWKMDWGGGTVVDGQLVQNIGNRLIVFPAYAPHQAQPVSRQCYDLRTVVVFKTWVDK